ncbi:MAG: hypothetical protein HKN13_12660, partial [Rhodothermales bacterium]|nr:hypothetical protein [Rhodothermales bacterium]
MENLEQGAPETAERDFESEARQDGWCPKEEWRGDPDKWVDAQEFVARGENIRPILQANNAKLKTQLEQMDKRVNELLQTNSEFKQFAETQRQKERESYERRIKELEALRSKAVTEGDGATFQQTEAELNQLRQNKPAPQQQGLSPDMQQWLDANNWYNPESSDFNVQRAAAVDGAATVVKHQQPHLSGADFLNASLELAKEKEPALF